MDSKTTGDFRDAAVAQSQRILAELERERHEQYHDPMLAGISYCLPTPGDSSSVRQSLRRISILGLILGVGGLAFGGVIAFWLKNYPPHPNPDEWFYMIIAGSGTCSGFIFLFGSIAYCRRSMSEHILGRMRESKLPELINPIRVEIENTATYSVPKMLSEDCGFLVMHASPPCVQIEGLSHRYLIWPEDVVSIAGYVGKYDETVVLAYNIQGVTLSITIKPTSIGANFKRQLHLGGSGLLKRMQNCLSNGPGK